MKQNSFYLNFPPGGAFPRTTIEWTSFGRSTTTVLVQPPPIENIFLRHCTSTSYCDFVAWREEELFIQRIYPNEQFIALALEKVTSFIKLGVLPELLGKWYSKGPVSTSSQPPNSCSQANEWCYCKQGEEGQMIACDNKDCSIVWFHTACLRITNIPKGKWYCPDCRKIVKRGVKKDRLSMH